MSGGGHKIRSWLGRHVQVCYTTDSKVAIRVWVPEPEPQRLSPRLLGQSWTVRAVCGTKTVRNLRDSSHSERWSLSSWIQDPFERFYKKIKIIERPYRRFNWQTEKVQIRSRQWSSYMLLFNALRIRCFFSTVWNPLDTQWIDRIRWWHRSGFQLLAAAAEASKSCLWMKGLNQGNCVTRTVDDEADIVCWTLFSTLFFPNILQLYLTRQCFAKYLAQFQSLSPTNVSSTY